MSDCNSVQRDVCARLPTALGEFSLCLYTTKDEGREHLALVKGDVKGREGVLVRVHSECFTGDVLGSRRCDCGEQLQRAMQRIAESECGILIYLRQEGRGIGLREKLRAYNLQDQGLDTVEANLRLGHPVDNRTYEIAAAILKDLGPSSIRLLTNNPDKVRDLVNCGIRILERLPMVPTVYPENIAYLLTKVFRLNHWIDLEALYGSSAHSIPGNGKTVVD